MITPSAAFPPITSSSSSSYNFNLLLLCRVLKNTRSSSTPAIPRTSIVFHHVPSSYHAFSFNHQCRLRQIDVSLQVTNESSSTEVSPDATSERSEADKIVDGMDFGELCNDFECISSPSVESTARQLVRDILQLRQGNRALGTFAVSVKYKDPVRSFTGRDKYKRQLWVNDALENPTVSVQQMVMLSTSVLNIKWTVKGKPKSPIFRIGGDLSVKVDSKFTLNQISGQVIEHEELWDLSESSIVAQAYFWASRRLFATFEAGKDVSDFLKDLTDRFTTENKNFEMYPDPTGDPTKFFQRDDSFQRDLYQIALFLAVVYFVVQYLRATL
ncbi:hypothetical protein Sango_2700300 [Sesamum angolense]|uniref:AT1G65230-like protein n=1 Tax=Sesamum angolense TaxID=2727404 RepID=A0AAE1W2Y4_9LAMI|nr:hypothetical protein Sango_2700300 [Sesamum angolense]